MFKQDTPALKILRESIEHSGAAIEFIYAGDRVESGPNVAIEVLHPPPEGMPGRDNANSVVLAVEHAGKRILLTGDLEPPGSQALLNELPLHCDVLLCRTMAAPTACRRPLPIGPRRITLWLPAASTTDAFAARFTKPAAPWSGTPPTAALFQ